MSDERGRGSGLLKQWGKSRGLPRQLGRSSELLEQWGRSSGVERKQRLARAAGREQWIAR